MQGVKPITTSVYTFKKLIEGGFLYVDKTRWLYDLVKFPDGVFFLSRPRRFGKSLTLSTLESIFLGAKDLFKGLYIYDQPFEWKEHPIIRIDLGDKQAGSAEELKEKLDYSINNNADRYGITLQRNGPDSRFEELVLALKDRGQVVILVDEYDKPILGNIGNPELPQLRNVLKAFYSVIKGVDEHLRFAFMTGVSKFSQVSIFSDLNNLTDLTMMEKFAEMPGFTQEEVEDNYTQYIDQLAGKEGMARSQLVDKIREWYNGYRFSKKEVTLYNPVSIGKLFENLDFKNYWFETGTPSFLIHLLKEKQFDIAKMLERPVGPETFSVYDVEHLTVLPIFFQTGYLTIKDTVATSRQPLYRLGYPNIEVEESLNKCILKDYSQAVDDVSCVLYDLQTTLRQGDMGRFFEMLRIFFADIPYTIQLKHEKYYQTIFFVLFRLIGLDIEAEVTTNVGRIDAVVETEDTVFVFEFKLQGTAEEAIAQIKAKHYAQKYENSGKIIRLIGAAFDETTRNLERWIEET
ncbi:MAG: AAA family ATPase [Spartobacteria bacterium]|nr:AAA family ATPase [Spartobacteria bacterium]